MGHTSFLSIQIDDIRLFDKNFDENEKDNYVNGFGNWEDKAYWLGLEQIHKATKTGDWNLLLAIRWHSENEGVDYRGASHIVFNGFKVESAVKEYTIRLKNITYTSINHKFAREELMAMKDQPFSSEGRVNAPTAVNCAMVARGGWWFGNGYRKSDQTDYDPYAGCYYYCLNCRFVYSKNHDYKVIETFMGMQKCQDDDKDQLYCK